MRELFSTRGLPRDAAFRRWRELIHERVVPVELTPQQDQPFRGRLDTMQVGALQVTRVTQTAMLTRSTQDTIRRHRKQGTVTVMVVLDGVVSTDQHDRGAVQQAGEFVVLDRQVSTLLTTGPSKVLLVEAPRGRLETALGPVRLYSSLTVGARQPATPLATNFLRKLVGLGRELSPASAATLGSVFLDLVTASLAERLAQEAPAPVLAAALMERARAYIRDNSGDSTLDPPQVAAAVGMSVRALQVMFKMHGLHVSECIWQHRLRCSAGRLSNPLYADTSIGTIAHQCGFATHAHFTRQFKGRYGLTPGEFRARARSVAGP